MFAYPKNQKDDRPRLLLGDRARLETFTNSTSIAPPLEPFSSFGMICKPRYT